MNGFTTTVVSALILVGGMMTVGRSELVAATTLTDSTVEAIDSTGLKITIQLAGGGDKLIMTVASPEVMKGVMVGDRVRLELDAEGRVVKIVRIVPDIKESPEPRS